MGERVPDVISNEIGLELRIILKRNEAAKQVIENAFTNYFLSLSTCSTF
jgi:hypothetical protein